MVRNGFIIALATFALPTLAVAYPGGTPSYQTDIAPFCAACHSSVSVAALAGAGEHHGVLADDVAPTNRMHTDFLAWSRSD